MDAPLYAPRQALSTGQELPAEIQIVRLDTLFADEQYEPVHLAWSISQRVVDA